jgi:hypothetical protein
MSGNGDLLISRKNRKHWVKCQICGENFSYYSSKDSITSHMVCRKCRCVGNSEWRKKHCSICGVLFIYKTNWDPIPRFCKKCFNNKKERNVCLLRRTGFICAHCSKVLQSDFVKQGGKKYCEECYSQIFSIVKCEKCSSDFVVLYKVNRKKTEFCSYCFREEKERIIRTRQSIVEYSIESDITYYIDTVGVKSGIFRTGSVYDHVLREEHKWSEELTDIEIFKNIASLASSISNGVLEFISIYSGNIIKFDINTNLLVVLDPRLICRLTTSYIVDGGINTMVVKSLRGSFV